MESSLIKKKLTILNKKMALVPNRYTQLKKFFSEAHLQIKYEDWSVSQNILVVCTGLAVAQFSCLKCPIKKKSGKIPWTSYSIFLVRFRFRTVQGRNGEW